MKENKLKSMAENKKFEELTKNKQELERLSNITDISEVLEVLNKHGYNGTKQDLERDLFEILQGLSEDDLQNISGGKIWNKKYLAGLMGGLTMMSAMGLNTSAQEGNHSNVKTKSETSFFNKEDKKTISIAGTTFVMGGIFVEALNLLFRKTNIEDGDLNVGQVINDSAMLKYICSDLTETEQQICYKTVKLSTTILKYVTTWIGEHQTMPPKPLTADNPAHLDILYRLKDIRLSLIDLYESQTGAVLDKNWITSVIHNKPGRGAKPVEIDPYAIIKAVDLAVPTTNTREEQDETYILEAKQKLTSTLEAIGRMYGEIFIALEVVTVPPK